ncbi:MAG: hypothetical protein OEZ39_01740 [Gammaproteobacteria bacterium]|nr:hypothetical protein [Gammaproteobacteria bacterium]MDH5650575.1 hypothetical protein [Gammaproteobacteria bacterium]
MPQLSRFALVISLLVSACSLPAPVRMDEQLSGIVLGKRYACYTGQRDEAVEARLMRVVAAHAPTQATIIRRLHAWEEKYCTSKSTLAEYLDKQAKPDSEEELKKLSTSVHELMHRFSTADPLGVKNPHRPAKSKTNGPYFDTGLGQHYMAVYLPTRGVMYILMQRNYSSGIADSLVHDKTVRTPRYNVYVKGRSGGQGVFDLLDEYHAYYHGFAYHEALVQARQYSIVTERKETKYFNGLPNVSTYTKYKPLSDQYLAHPQFTYYILTYMLALQQKAPQIYARFIDNRPLWQAFVDIHDHFEPLYQGYIARRTKQQAKYKYALSASLEQERAALEQHLASAPYQSLMRDIRQWAGQ